MADETPVADGNVVDPSMPPDSSFIYDTSLEDLSGADAYFDNQTVQVTGEVVGDAVRANLDGSTRWITLESLESPGSAALAIEMDAESVELIDTFGDYGATGTTLRVQGTYHLACSEHEGISDLHADIVNVVAPGAQRPSEFDAMGFVPGGVLIVIGLALLAVYRFVRERGR